MARCRFSRRPMRFGRERANRHNLYRNGERTDATLTGIQRQDALLAQHQPRPARTGATATLPTELSLLVG